MILDYLNEANSFGWCGDLIEWFNNRSKYFGGNPPRHCRQLRKCIYRNIAGGQGGYMSEINDCSLEMVGWEILNPWGYEIFFVDTSTLRASYQG